MKIVDSTLINFRRALEGIYGDRLERVILFGLRARGEARPDSDYDVAVFLNSMPDRWQELDRLSDLSLDFVDKTGAVINALPYLAAGYQERTPLMASIRQEGLDV
jgi:predicted nucleotidyltransferase